MPDPSTTTTIFGSLTALLVLSAIGVIAILWIVLPFSIFGIKDLINKNIDEQKETNRQLRAINEKLEGLKGEKETSGEVDPGGALIKTDRASAKTEKTDTEIEQGPQAGEEGPYGQGR